MHKLFSLFVKETGFLIADDRPDLSGFMKMQLESVSESKYNSIIARDGG